MARRATIGVMAAAALLAFGGTAAWRAFARPVLVEANARLVVRQYPAAPREKARVVWRAGPVGTFVEKGDKVLETVASPSRAPSTAEPEVFHAPFDGTIVDARAAAGDVLGAGQLALLIAERGAAEVEAEVPAEHASRIALGGRVEVRLRVDPRAPPLTGRVSRIGPASDRGPVPVRITLDASLPPAQGGIDGQACRATFLGRRM